MAKRKKDLNAGVESDPLPIPVKPMRRGSIGQRYTKCGKPGCRCKTSEDGRHGPYFSLTRTIEGRTKSRWLGPDQVEVVRRQLAEGDRFRGEVDAYWEVCEALADAELESTRGEVSRGEAEKGGFRRRSSPASSKRSSSS